MVGIPSGRIFFFVVEHNLSIRSVPEISHKPFNSLRVCHVCFFVGRKLSWCCDAVKMENRLYVGYKRLIQDFQKLERPQVSDGRPKALLSLGVYIRSRTCVDHKRNCPLKNVHKQLQ